MLRARDAMDRAYAQPLDGPALARIAHVSEAHFTRTFRATFGETPHRYLQRRRIERAGTGSATTISERGQLVSVTPLRTLPGRNAVRAELASDGFDATSARYGVRTYRLVYRTVGTRGQPTTASGLMALPVNGPRLLTMVSFTHGTESCRRGIHARRIQPGAPCLWFAGRGVQGALRRHH
jgi:Bacterial regulatory helix-turn-helix proteins, AraC family